MNCSPLIVFLQRTEKIEEIHSVFITGKMSSFASPSSRRSQDVYVIHSLRYADVQCSQRGKVNKLWFIDWPVAGRRENCEKPFHLGLFDKKEKGKKYRSCYLQEFKPSPLEYIKFRKHINVPQNPQDRFQLTPPRFWWQNILAT